MNKLIKRSKNNPLISPNNKEAWQTQATFNPSAIKKDRETVLLFRALSNETEIEGQKLPLSTIGIAKIKDGEKFSSPKQLITPSTPWDRFGCEDPRVTKIDNKYYIFYTALSTWPPKPEGIKVGLAISKDLETIKEKRLITPFNAKAMTLFPKKVGDRYLAILSTNTDLPPSKTALKSFNKIEELWNQELWQKWYQNLDKNTINLKRLNSDQIEIGARPVELDQGWLLIYSHIRNYYQDERIFGIEAVLLDKKNPKKIVFRTNKPLLLPKKEYEKDGVVSNVTFPSGAIKNRIKLEIYYGAADTYCAKASLNINRLLNSMRSNPTKKALKVKKYNHNPILKPLETNDWEAQAVFNPTVFRYNDIIYLLYRAFSKNNTSTIGLATSNDGYSFNRYDQPIYIPRADFEKKKKANCFSGCEDPRITKIDNKYYLLYTAFDGVSPPRVAMSYIKTKDFHNNDWNWSKPKLVSPPNSDDKDACLFPEKINGKYLLFHRVGGREIAIDYLDDLIFEKNEWLEKEGMIGPRSDMWDDEKIGINTIPLKTEKGWLVLYHGVSSKDNQYRVGTLLLDLNKPEKVIYRSKYPILEPTEIWEKKGLVDNVVFPCGKIKKGNKILIYYGGADKVIGVAEIELKQLLKKNY